jgi:uncharacterized membrane protein
MILTGLTLLYSSWKTTTYTRVFYTGLCFEVVYTLLFSWRGVVGGAVCCLCGQLTLQKKKVNTKDTSYNYTLLTP